MSRIIYQQLEPRPIPPSPIQQMKNIAGMPDTPDAEFVAWFQKVFGLLVKLNLTVEGSYPENARTAETIGLVNDRDPLA